MRFRLQFPSADVETHIHDVLKHLEAEDRPTNEGHTTSLLIIADRNRFTIDCDGIEPKSGLQREQLIPRIHQILLTRAYEDSGCLAGFHAGSIAKNGGSLLLPGASGSGKSTLIAAMAHAGCRYLTDELVLFMHNNSLRPLPVALGLKKGSWPLLAPTIPTLQFLESQKQEDGKEVRYIIPAQIETLSKQPSLRALVFPRYQAGSQSKLSALTPAKAFYHLALAGYAVPGGLNSRVVKTLIDWVSAQDCYELQVGNLQDAVSLAGSLLE